MPPQPADHVPQQTAPVIMDEPITVQFKKKLEALLAEYPTVRLTVNHQISIDELKPITPGNATN